jgi:hypothetical protein
MVRRQRQSQETRVTPDRILIIL